MLIPGCVSYWWTYVVGREWICAPFPGMIVSAVFLVCVDEETVADFQLLHLATGPRGVEDMAEASGFAASGVSAVVMHRV